MNENPSPLWKKSEKSFLALEFLAEQVKALSEFTEGWVFGTLYTEPTLDEFSVRLIISPRTIEYEYEVFSLSFPVDQYPITIRANEDVNLELYHEASPIIRAGDEDEFVAILSDILASHTVTRVLETLTAVARDN